MRSKNTNNRICKWAKKLLAIRHLGGVCSECRESNITLLVFHHSGTKKHSIQRLLQGSALSEILLKELDECVLLCRRCHLKLHASGRSMKGKRIALDGRKPVCTKCGYNDIAGIEFHHKNASDKKFRIACGCVGDRLIKGIQEILEESRKCEILCSNCHMLIHTDSFVNDNQLEIERKADSFQDWSQSRIDIQTLAELAKSKTITEIASIMNRNKSTVASALKRLGISAQGRMLSQIDMDKLSELYNERHSIKEIARIMDRKYSSIYSAIKRL